MKYTPWRERLPDAIMTNPAVASTPMMVLPNTFCMKEQ